MRVGLRARAGGEARQREAEDVAARPPGAVHRLRGDDQRVGRVEAAGDADDDLRVADRAQPLLQPGDLDVVGLVAVEVEPVDVGGDERVALDGAPEAEVAVRRVERERDAAEGARAVGVGAAVVVERPHAAPLLQQQVDVDVGDRPLVAFREALGLGEQHAVLVDRRLAVPRQVGRRLALAGGGVHVGGEAARRRRAAQQLAVLGPADGDRAAGQVEQQRRARQRGLRARRDRDPHVLADLDVDHEPGEVVGGEQQVGAERQVLAGDADLAALVDARGELPALVELAVGRRVGLRHDPEDAAAVDHHRAVVDAVAMAQRRADHEQRQQLGGPLGHGGQRALHVVEHRVLEHEVLERVARERHLGEQRDRHALLRALARLAQHHLRVGRRIGDRHAAGAGGDAGEPVLVDRAEVHVERESYPLRRRDERREPARDADVRAPAQPQRAHRRDHVIRDLRLDRDRARGAFGGAESVSSAMHPPTVTRRRVLCTGTTSTAAFAPARSSTS